jgi:hypothetical protein
MPPFAQRGSGHQPGFRYRLSSLMREAGQVADMRRLVDELDGLARSYERWVGESETRDEG